MGNRKSKDAEPPDPQETHSPSRPVPPPRQIFSEDPFRKTKWGKSSRNDLKAKIAALRPKTKLDVTSFNIVLMGEVGTGKSSFFNSINSIFNEALVASKAAVGLRPTSLTREFMRYDLGRDIAVTIGDTMGVQKDTTEVDIRNILRVVDGHVPHGHAFTPNEDFHCGSRKFIPNPTIADKAHCVAIVIDANKAYHMEENMVSKLQSLAEGLWTRKVPFIVLLTHLDEFSPDVKKDITKTFHVRPLEDLIHKISKIVRGLPQNQIYPVINYQSESDLDDDMDVLLLYALRTMVYAAQGHLETIESLHKQPENNSQQLKHGQQEEGSISPLKDEKTPMEVD